MYPESGIGAIGLGSVLLHQKEFAVARELLQKGKDSPPMAYINSFAILDYLKHCFFESIKELEYSV